MQSPIRKITEIEKMILEHLFAKASLHFEKDWFEKVLVQTMNDGGMGSFTIYNDASDMFTKRKFNRMVSDFQFIDDDEILVIVSLYFDDRNNPFEVDVWKVDYRPVLNFKTPTDN